jgi:hypothetical protein
MQRPTMHHRARRGSDERSLLASIDMEGRYDVLLGLHLWGMPWEFLADSRIPLKTQEPGT